MVYSDALQTARSSACRVLETCRGSTVVMLLMYRRKSVGEMSASEDRYLRNKNQLVPAQP